MRGVELRKTFVIKGFRGGFWVCCSIGFWWHLRFFLAVSVRISSNVCLGGGPIRRFDSPLRGWIMTCRYRGGDSWDTFTWFVWEWSLNKAKRTDEFEADLFPFLTNFPYHPNYQLVVLSPPSLLRAHQYSPMPAIAHAESPSMKKFGNLFPFYFLFLNQSFQ